MGLTFPPDWMEAQIAYGTDLPPISEVYARAVAKAIDAGEKAGRCEAALWLLLAAYNRPDELLTRRLAHDVLLTAGMITEDE